ncbi:diguanylate cyclase/phosphodiesterase (GGDEF & EAL domains) with PAS/PAC sensor(s) [hydrothermal vent metagenome]|uniref:Diguanylate cyclase/phosphodiesterase (GGDEF & EAL domains) with PAS/PAC sensor(S) n=1 Tax=hydrothermal vent metagenome TaxID=652676 RepID=A0A3B1AU12_9ZZZZ
MPKEQKYAEMIDSSNADAINEILCSILATILQLPWLETNAGGIFLAEPETRQLKLVAELNFSLSIKDSCGKVNYGHCLCGRVAESVEVMHVSCVDQRHDTHYEGMCDHGHYIVPIKLHNELLGVMVLYINTGHAYNTDEVQVLEDFAAIIALLINTAQIRLEKQLTDLILSHSAHGVTITDRDRKILWVNQAFQNVSGYSLEEVIGKTPAILKSGLQGSNFYTTMWRSIDEDGHWEGEIWNRRKNGEIYPEWLNIVSLKNNAGEVLRYAGMFIDLSPIKTAEEKIHRLAYYDDITGLANASLLHQKLEKMLSRSRSKHDQIIVLTLDLDNFHEINAGLGRRVGNAVLREAARRISGVIEGAIEARMGADEFVIAYWQRHESDETLQLLIGKLATSLSRQLQQSFKFEQHELVMDSSIGIALGNGQDTDAESLLQRSGIALAHCKKHSRGKYQFYNQEMEQQADYRRFLGTAIGKAIERDELFLVYQPQLDRQNQVIGAEVLLRWHSEEYGNIPPDVFIGIAEERGHIIDIGRWVLDRTLDQMTDWHKAGLCDSGCFQRLAINVSPQQILSKNIAREFARACAGHGFSPESIELEITETGITQYSDHIIENLQDLSDKGFKIAIDDFGTGYSSLSRLQHFPVNILKIDRSFVNNMENSVSDAALVKSIIDMAHTLGFQVIAEGVEEASQLIMLMEFGCDIFQGYYFSKPVSADEFMRYAKQQAQQTIVSADAMTPK